jgi:GLPGLI family protein
VAQKHPQDFKPYFMKKVFCIAALFICSKSFSQVFISKGLVEYEVKVNNHKSFGDGVWSQMMKERVPQLSTSFYELTFSEDKSIYRFSKKDLSTKLPWGSEKEDDIWYNDYGNSNFVQQKNVFGDTYILSDSLLNIQWKITNESREIAGFNCRKASGIIFDSVYVFAFYTDEITVSGGPMSLHGLPGLILGVTIPRMFTSWVATRVQVNAVNDKVIVAPKKGKQKKASELKETVIKATKDWGNYGQQAVWNIFL